VTYELGLPRVSTKSAFVFPEWRFPLLRIKRIDKGSGDAVAGQGMGQQIIRAPINIICGDNMIPCPPGFQRYR
jgi:hypothetical protein